MRSKTQTWPLIPLYLGWLGSIVLAVMLTVLVRPSGPASLPDSAVGAMGWVQDPEVIAENLDPDRTPQFAVTPAGQIALGDSDAFLFRAVSKVNAREDGWYPNENQESVGCCVGCGFKHCADVVQATQILDGRAAEWKRVAIESIYGPSRVEIGGGRIRGDGSIGAWAAKAVQTIGVLAMEPYGRVDLSTFSPTRAREWGRTGMPDELEPIARQHMVKSTALVKTWADVKRAITQGYPVAVCSNQGFTMTRDRDGFARASGTWNHCMAIIGVRSGQREGGFILNSWGDRAHTGGVWPADMPVAGFWADAAVIHRMVAQGDSFALSDMEGFPARQIDSWFSSVPQRTRDKLGTETLLGVAW